MAEAEDDSAALTEPEAEEPDEECLTNLFDNAVSGRENQGIEQAEKEALMGHMEMSNPPTETFFLQNPNSDFQ